MSASRVFGGVLAREMPVAFKAARIVLYWSGLQVLRLLR